MNVKSFAEFENYHVNGKIKPNVSIDFAGIKLKNPVLTASGTFGYGEEYAEFVDLNKLGGVIVKGISLKPIKGNPPPRIWETPSGMLNAIGLENPGLDVFINEKLPYLRQFDTAVIVNILVTASRNTPGSRSFLTAFPE